MSLGWNTLTGSWFLLTRRTPAGLGQSSTYAFDTHRDDSLSHSNPVPPCSSLLLQKSTLHLANYHYKEHSLLSWDLVVCTSCVCLGLIDPLALSCRLLWTTYYIGAGNKPRSSARAVRLLKFLTAKPTLWSHNYLLIYYVYKPSRSVTPERPNQG